MTVRDLHSSWAEVLPRPNSETDRHNARMLRGYVREFGGRPLEAVTPLEAARWAAANPGSIRYVRTFYADARKLGLVTFDPFAGVTSPVSHGRRDVPPPTQLEVRLLAAHAGELFGARFAALVLVAGTTGIRQGEFGQILAGQVERLPYTRIRLPADQTKGRLHERLIVFAPGAEDADEALLKVLPQVGRVFPFGPTGIRRRWSELTRRAGGGLRRVRFHDLRHAAATWLAESGVDPRDIAAMLHGHTDPALVLSLYAHHDREAAADRIRGL